MKFPAFIALICLSACKDDEQKTVTIQDTAKSVVRSTQPDTQTKTTDTVVKKQPGPVAKVYSNARFKDVSVKHLGNNKYMITGKGQIFEASFNWVIEDGHEELQNGYTTTDAGAPEWGNFSFTVQAKKERENSTLHLILFEASAKDGSRQYELPVLLY